MDENGGAVVLEVPQETEDSSTKTWSTTDLTDWNYKEYEQYFPEEVKDFLTTMFTEEKYGWKDRARKLKTIAHWTKYIEGVREELVESCTGVRAPRTISPRDGLRAFLAALPEDKIQQLCEEKSVSYESFMAGASPNKDMLIEALMDEMFS